MKKKFVTKNTRKKKRYKFLFFFVLFLLGIYISFKLLDKSSVEISDQSVAKFLVDLAFDRKIFSGNDNFNQILNPTLLLENNYTNFEIDSTSKEEEINPDINSDVNRLPLIYIYNSHQTEEYSPSTFAEFSVNPTVMVADYILADIFRKNNFEVIVEERSVKDILNQNMWRYSYSYAASRILMEEAARNYPSLVYFIDVHRDSLEKDKTTVEIDGRTYAKTIFLIGLENENYQENLQFTTLINDKMNEKYPGLSKGIYKKGGSGVNGVYNQDFSNRTILIEMGGYQNNLAEVLNSVLAFSDCFMEVINGENQKNS